MNAVIYLKGSNEISHFVKNCVKGGKRGTDYIGSNVKILGAKSTHHNVIWTEDDVNPLYDIQGKQIGWDKLVSDITPNQDGPVEQLRVSSADYCQAFKIRKLLDRLSYQGIEDYIDANVTDLPSAKIFLKKLSKVVLALAKIMDKKL